MAWALAIALLVAVAAGFVLLRPSATSSSAPRATPTSSGSPAAFGFSRLVGRQAPEFSLLDQFGHLHRVSSFRGRGVLLTFVSSRCRNICPLIASLLLRTQHLLGPRSRHTELVAVNANPRYTSVRDVLRWSQTHSMTHRWLFLTGPPTGSGPVTGLASVWRSYGVVGGGAHTTIVFVIDPRGRIRTVVPIAQRSSLGAEAHALARFVRGIEGRTAA
jgi:cytochrome oxidase Cu insertion factor (SCO1/SenC/PrrC family)